MKISLALALAPVLIALGSTALAQSPAPEFGDLSSRPVGTAVQPARNKADRESILFLAAHVKELDKAIADARQLQQQMLAEAKAQEEAAKAAAAEAERRKREANSRAVGNALLLLTGADAQDVNTYNRIMDVHDVLAASTPEARKAAEQRTIAPTALLLLGADVENVNDLDTFSSGLNAMSASARAKAVQQHLQQAQQNSRATTTKAMTLDESIKAMSDERSRALDLLAGYSKRYLAAVNDLVAAIPGFKDSFGSVKDLAFDFSLAADSAGPLILALTFQIRGDNVDVRLTDLDQFLSDHFAKLISDRQTNVAKLTGEVAQKQADLDALSQKADNVQSQIASLQQQRAALTGLRNVFGRARLDSDVDKLKGTLPTRAQQTAAQTALKAKQDDLARARALLARAEAARAMLSKIDEAKATAALAQIRAML